MKPWRITDVCCGGEVINLIRQWWESGESLLRPKLAQKLAKRQDALSKLKPF